MAPLISARGRAAGSRAAARCAAVLVLLGAASCAGPGPRERALLARIDLARPFPESRFAEVDGVRLHYRVFEPAQGAPRGRVLLVHGFGGSTFSFRKTVPALVEAGNLVVAADLPGFGFSERKRGISHGSFFRARLLWKLLDRVEKDFPGGGSSGRPPWTLAGHSMGGSAITAMAQESPERVESLVYLAGAVFGSPPAWRGLQPSSVRWLLGLLIRSWFGNYRGVERALASAYGQEPDLEAIEGYLAPLLLPGTAECLLDMTQSPPEPERLDPSSLRAPALLIWGSRDAWVRPAAGERLRDRIPGARLEIIPGAGHCPLETHAGAVNRLLLDFLPKRKY